MATDMWMDFDDDILEELDKNFLVVYTMMVVCAMTLDSSNLNGPKEGRCGAIAHKRGVHDLLYHMRVIPQYFKIVTNFSQSRVW
jgi:hypothetical protein